MSCLKCIHWGLGLKMKCFQLCKSCEWSISQRFSILRVLIVCGGGAVWVTESNRVDEKPFENDLRSRKLETNSFRVLIYIAIIFLWNLWMLSHLTNYWMYCQFMVNYFWSKDSKSCFHSPLCFEWEKKVTVTSSLLLHCCKAPCDPFGQSEPAPMSARSNGCPVVDESQLS
jgi:hypothetical protein